MTYSRTDMYDPIRAGLTPASLAAKVWQECCTCAWLHRTNVERRGPKTMESEDDEAQEDEEDQQDQAILDAVQYSPIAKNMTLEASQTDEEERDASAQEQPTEATGSASGNRARGKRTRGKRAARGAKRRK